MNVDDFERYGANARHPHAALAHLRALIAHWPEANQAEMLRSVGSDARVIEAVIRHLLKMKVQDQCQS